MRRFLRRRLSRARPGATCLLLVELGAAARRSPRATCASMFGKSSFQAGLVAPAQRRLHRRARAGAVSSTRSASSSVKACDCGSFGRPAGLPSGKSVNRKRGTPTYSTMSLAQPMTTVGMPFCFEVRAARLTVWWQTGQVGDEHARRRPRPRGSAPHLRAVGLERDAVAAVGRRAVEARRQLADPPAAAAARAAPAAGTRCCCPRPWCARGRSRRARCADRGRLRVSPE